MSALWKIKRKPKTENSDSSGDSIYRTLHLVSVCCLNSPQLRGGQLSLSHSPYFSLLFSGSPLLTKTAYCSRFWRVEDQSVCS